MRMQVTRAGLLSATTLAAILVGAMGCDDYTSGHLSDPKGPPKLLKIMVQDSPESVDWAINNDSGVRGGTVDLLHKENPIGCDDPHPCQVTFAVAFNNADFTCRPGGDGRSWCNDPMLLPAVTGVPVNDDVPAEDPAPAMPAMPGTPADPATCTPAQDPTEATEATEGTPAIPGTAIRLVFDRILDVGKLTDGDALREGIIELIDEGDGKPVPFETLNGRWDGSGPPEFTSDPLLIPFGPAIQIAPLGLKHSTTYSIIVHPEMMVDRKGNGGLTFADGTPVPPDFKISFTTESIGADISTGSFQAVTPTQFPGDFSPVYGQPVFMYDTDVLQFAFHSSIDSDTFEPELIGPDGNPIDTWEVYIDSPKNENGSCLEDDANDRQINVAMTDGGDEMGNNPKPIKWPLGIYKIRFANVESPDDNTSVNFDSKVWPGADKDGWLTFEVKAAPEDNSPATDGALLDQHPTPEQMCPCI
jgi:hypothetical protein